MGSFEKEYGGGDPPEEPNEEPENAAIFAAIGGEQGDVQDEDSAVLLDAERRLAKAAYYREVVRNGMIQDSDGDDSIAAEVNAEGRAWARRMMVKLLGGNTGDEQAVVQAPAPPQFNDQEMMILKKIIEVASPKYASPPEPKSALSQAPSLVPRRTAPAAKPPTRPQPKVAAKPPAKQAPKPKAPPAPPQSKPPVQKPKAGAAPSQPVKKSNLPEGVIDPPIGEDGKIDYDAIETGQPFKDVGGIWRFSDNKAYDPERSYEALVAAGVPPKFAEKQQSKPRNKVRVQARPPGASTMPMSPQMLEAYSLMQSTAGLNSGAAANATMPSDPDHTQPGGNTLATAAAHVLANQ